MILVEVLGIAVLVGVGAVIPQEGVATPGELESFALRSGNWSVWLAQLGLQRVVKSPLFLVLLTMAAASLSLVVASQWRRLEARWSQRPGRRLASRAPYLHEAVLSEGEAVAMEGEEAWVEGRWGWVGSPLFHVGLLLLIVAGGYRALFEARAQTDLLVGESLAAGSGGWAAQWPGLAGRLFGLDGAIRLEDLEVSRYESGKLQRVEARIRRVGEEVEILGINRPLRWGTATVYLTQDLGAAAFLEWSSKEGKESIAALLRRRGREEYRDSAELSGGFELHLRARQGTDGRLPEALDIRLAQGSTLLYAGPLAPGEEIGLPDGRRLRLPAIRYWVRLAGSRDEAVYLVYLAVALLVVGAVLFSAVVPVEFLRIVETREDTRYRVLAMRPARFAPLYRERFQRWIEEESRR